MAVRAGLGIAWLFAAATVLLEIAYPLVHGHPRDLLTVVTVLTFCAASTVHAAITRGTRWAAGFLAVTVSLGLVAEAVGTATGLPFGHYMYADSLGAKLLGVPLVIPLAWTMMAYPCLLVGQALGRNRITAALIGGWALAAWDLFLDPQLVAKGHWRWAHVRHAVPGSPGVPLSNTVGWLVVATLMLGLLQLLPRSTHDDRQPAVLFLWTYVSSVLAAAAFFGRPTTALVGGIGMGLVAIPFARSLRA